MHQLMVGVLHKNYINMNKFITLHLLLINFVFLYSQQKEKKISELEIKYLYSYNLDTLNVSKRDEDIMSLYLGEKASFYISDAHLQTLKIIKSKLSNVSNIGIEINAKDLPKYKVKYSVFNDNGKVYVNSPIGSDNFIFEAKNPIWNLKYDMQKVILGYNCFMATTIFNKRQYIAWYTREIPFPDGPYRFKGLPGLVLEVEDLNKYDRINAISIQKKQEFIEPIKGILVDRDVYLKKREEFKNNPYPNNNKITKERRDYIIEMSKKMNNSLEK